MAIDSLNFNRAEFGTPLPPEDCQWCTRALESTWYTANETRICASCAQNARSAIHGESPKIFWRSLAFGSMTAVMCGLAYYAFFHLTGGSLAVFACWGVGYFIGKMMRVGSNGIGGRRYQIAAAVLTYAAITIATSVALAHGARVPVWAYPLFLFAPIFLVFLGQVSLAGLLALFLIAGIRWAWALTAGPSLKIAGPFYSEAPAA